MSQRAQSRPPTSEPAAKSEKAETRTRRPAPVVRQANDQAGQEPDRPGRFNHDFSQVSVANSPPPAVALPSESGHPLPAPARSEFETRFGHSFDQVRIHTSEPAAGAAEALQADAFTQGQNIYFARDRFRPQSSDGRSLLAHELAHTIQQNGVNSSTLQPRSRLVSPRHPLEREAEEAARQVLAGPPTGDRLPPALTRLPAGGNPPVLRRRVDAQTAVQTDQDAGPSPSLDAVIGQVQTVLENDPRDRSGAARRILWRFDPLTRQLILARARARIGPELVEPAAEPEIIEEEERPAEEQATAESEAAETAAGEPQTPEQEEVANEAEAEEQSAEGERPGLEAQARDQAEQTSDLPDASTAAESAAPAQEAQQQVEETADAVQSEVEIATGEASAEPEAAAEAGQEATEEGAEEAAEEGEEAAEEAEAADEETASEGDLSLRARLDPVQEPSGEPSEAEIAAAESYDAAAAQAEAQAAASEIQTAAAAAEQQINTETAATRSRITAAAEGTRTRIHAQIAAQTEALNTKFDGKTAEFNTTFDGIRSSLEYEYEARVSEVQTNGDGSKEALATRFSDQRTNINNAVEGKVGEAEDLTTRHVRSAQTRTQRQAREAESRGRAKARTYPNTGRGRVQKRAAIGVADKTAQEIRDREPETLQAIVEVTADIPDEFRAKGVEALDGFDAGLPDLQARVDEYMATTTTNLDSTIDQARTALDGVQTSVSSKLEAMRASANAQLAALGPQADVQIDAGLQSALAPLNVGPRQVIGQINQVTGEAVQILAETEEPDIAATQEFRGQVLGFVDEATSGAAADLQQAAAQIAPKFSEVEQTAATGLQTMQQQADTELQTLTDETTGKLTEIETNIAGSFESSMTEFNGALEDSQNQVDQQLNQMVIDLEAELDIPLQEAEAEISEAENEGLAKNDEALGDLDGAMREAASDAAWDYDHPILSAIADFASFIAGAIIAIVGVLLLVVAVIVLIKVAVFILVVAGISAAVAELIVAVAGLALLAYGIYQAYQTTGSFTGALLEITGLADIGRAFSDPNLSPFEAGLSFGKGVGTLGTFFIGRGMGKRVNARFNARFPRVANPRRGSAWSFLRPRGGGRGTGGPAPVAQPQSAAPELTQTQPAAPAPAGTQPAAPARPQPAAPGPARPQPAVQAPAQPQPVAAAPDSAGRPLRSIPGGEQGGSGRVQRLGQLETPEGPIPRIGRPRPQPPRPVQPDPVRPQPAAPARPAQTGPATSRGRVSSGRGRRNPGEGYAREQTPDGDVIRPDRFRGPDGRTPTEPQAAAQRQALPAQQAAGAEGFTPRTVAGPSPAAGEGGRGGLRIEASGSRSSGGRPTSTSSGRVSSPTSTTPSGQPPGRVPPSRQLTPGSAPQTTRPTPAPATSGPSLFRGRVTRFISGATVRSRGRVVARGTVDVGPTLSRIRRGIRFPHRNDGSVFGNREGLLPSRPQGYYREYVHPTPGVNGPGPQRLIVGQGGEVYYTPDHYGSFIPLN